MKVRMNPRLAVAALVAVIVLASATAASARIFSITDQHFRIVWTPLTLSDAFGFVSVRCNFTMEGSFHSNTITKVIGSLIGYVTAARYSRPCTNGEAWIWNGTEGELSGASTLPWHITYEGFNGTLPNVTRLRWLVARAKFTIRNGICLGTYAPANANVSANMSAGTATVTWEGENVAATEGECPALRHTGTSQRATVLGTTTSLTWRLI